MVHHILDNHIDVILQHRTDGDDGSLRVVGGCVGLSPVGGGGLTGRRGAHLIRDRARDEFPNLLVLLNGLVLLDEVHFVLENDDVPEAHDLHRGQVLRRLRLRAGLIPCISRRGGQGVSPGGGEDPGGRGSKGPYPRRGVGQRP